MNANYVFQGPILKQEIKTIETNRGYKHLFNMRYYHLKKTFEPIRIPIITTSVEKTILIKARNGKYIDINNLNNFNQLGLYYAVFQDENYLTTTPDNKKDTLFINESLLEPYIICKKSNLVDISLKQVKKIHAKK